MHMIRFVKRVLKDRRGNALAIAAAALPLVVGSAGLATDTIQWAMWKRQLQRAADSGALAGAYGIAQGQTANDAVNRDLAINSHVGITTTKNIENAPTSGPWAGNTSAVRVTLSVQKKLSFSSLFMSTPPTISATATAALVDDGEYCVVTLKKTGTALTIAGSANVRMGCGAISNSTDPTGAADTSGNAHYFEADPVAAAGGMPDSINGVTELDPFHVPLPDPYAGKYSTDIPADKPCTNFNHPTKQNADGSMIPGCYNSFGGGTLSPGVYYLNSADIKLTGHERISGTGVTIILTGNNPGKIDMSGNSSMDITAPTSGDYANMLILQAANADPTNVSKINGDNGSAFDGAIYMPKGNVEFTGSSAGATKCAMVVSYTVTFSGSTNIQNDTIGCEADTTVSAKAVRLVA